jgi:hypothetical protein
MPLGSPEPPPPKIARLSDAQDEAIKKAYNSGLTSYREAEDRLKVAALALSLGLTDQQVKVRNELIMTISVNH